MQPKTMMIDNVKYVREDSIDRLAMNTDGLKFVVTRSVNAGVHVGYLSSVDGKEVTLFNSIRIWYWKGAASLSQLAVDGVNKADECKFAVPVSEIFLSDVCEVIYCTDKAMKSLQGVKAWEQ